MLADLDPPMSLSMTIPETSIYSISLLLLHLHGDRSDNARRSHIIHIPFVAYPGESKVYEFSWIRFILSGSTSRDSTPRKVPSQDWHIPFRSYPGEEEN
jgi:hypothetical protein